MIRSLSTALVALSLAGCSGMMSSMSSAPAKVSDGALVGANGMTLYTFDRDAAGTGKSACNGAVRTELAAAHGAGRATRPAATGAS